MFTTDWFSGAIDGIERTLRGRNPTEILEIGSWEGRSACWFLERFPEARLTCVDTFQGSVEHEGMDVAGIKERFEHNTRPYADRLRVLEGESSKMLYVLPPESFDVVYVDGSHEEDDALMDLVLSFGLLRPGGVLLVDDYEGGNFGVKAAVDAFASAFCNRVSCVLCEYQIHFVKH